MADLLKWLRVRSEKLDDRLRFRDLHVHRTVGGQLDRWFSICRHTRPALTLPCLICGLIVLASPSSDRILMAIGCAVLVGLVLTIYMRRSARNNWPVQLDLLLQCLVVLLVAAIVWRFGKDEYQDRGVYRHIFIVGAGLLALCLVVAAFLVRLMFRRIQSQSQYQAYLTRTELFLARGPAPYVTIGTILTSLVMVAFRAPLALLTLPAIVALISPTAFIWYLTIPTLAICFLGLFFAGLNERFGAMWSLTQGVFFKGGALLVSVVAIILGIGRLAGNTYVTPVFDTAAWYSLGITLASVYILSWWYDYWSNRLLADQIITLLNPAAGGRARIPYNIAVAPATKVPAADRFLQIHGAGRFLAYHDNPYFQAHTMTDLVSLIAESGAPGGQAVPTIAQVRSRILNFHSIVAVLFVVLLGAELYHLYLGKQDPEVCLELSNNGLDLKNLLFDEKDNSPDRILVVIAGSGGGTRAALYTASVLEGITNMGKGNDIVLASGVSGGGAALAYFAANRDNLTTTDDKARKGAWDHYFEIMAQPYIQDVLDRATEWRMAGPGRLGQLLAASFRRRWKLKDGYNKVSDVKNMGLIFNTSLAGHVYRPKNSPPGKLSDVEPLFRKETKSTLAGGRLLLTNLALFGLTANPVEPQDQQNPLPKLPVIIYSNGLRLEDAAALNANFPPVFSNAAIDVDDEVNGKKRETRYWVTDGGAVDNRGMEMMLFALRQALKDKKPDVILPRLFIVVADASALSDKYTQSRGVSSLAGAGTHFASHLDAELLEDIRRLYGDKADRLQFAYVTMPDHLRDSGSFGTNWMLQSWIRVRNESDSNSEDVTIKGEEMIRVLRALHTPGADKDLHPKPCQVLNWSRSDFGHKDGWGRVVKVLGGADRQPTCSTQ
jgi:Patatin-like phospholipase